MGPVRAFRRRLVASFSLALLAGLSLLALVGAGSASAAVCPSFEVLHDDRIGAAVLPAGTYSITTDEFQGRGISCQGASRLFARFLQDWDGNLPNGYLVRAEGPGKASFDRPSIPESPVGFSVSRTGGSEGGGGNGELGRLCPGSFTVNAGSDVGPLFFARGQYLLYIPARSGISCRRASVLFTRFLGSGGTLPAPWQVKTQTATFFKPAHPLRSAFRVEPADGVS